MPSLENNALEEYSLEIFRSFGIGDKEKNNGLLIFLALEDRKLRVDVGYGLEGILPDGKVGGLQDEFMIPYFSADEWDKGIKNGYDAFYKEIVEGNQLAIASTNPTAPPADLMSAKDAARGRLVAYLFFGGIIGIIYLFKLMSAIDDFKKASGDERKGLKRKVIRYAIFLVVLGAPGLCIGALLALIAAVVMHAVFLGKRLGECLKLKLAYKKYVVNARPFNEYSSKERGELARLKSLLGENLDKEALDKS